MVALTLAAALLSGCSKNSPPSASATPKSVTLGVVELAYNTPNRQDLGGGTVCVFTALPMDAASFELIAVIEKSGKKVASSRTAPTAIDQPLKISFGTINVELVPHIK